MVALDRAVCSSKCRAHARNACGGQCCLQAHRQRIPGAPFRCDVGAKCGGARVHQRGAPQRVAWQAEHPREHSIGSAPPCARWRLVLGGASLVAAWVNPSQSLTLVQLAAWRNSPWGYLHLSALTTAFAARTSGRGRTKPSLSRASAEQRPLEFDPKRAQAARRARILSREKRPCQGGLRSGCPQAQRGDGRRQHGRAEAMPAADNAQSLLTIPVAVAELLAGAVARKGASLVVGKAASDKCRRFCYRCQWAETMLDG